MQYLGWRQVCYVSWDIIPIVFHCPVRMIHLQKIVFEGQVYTDNDAYSVRFSVVFKKVFAQIFHQCIKEKEEPVQTDSSDRRQSAPRNFRFSEHFSLCL